VSYLSIFIIDKCSLHFHADFTGTQTAFIEKSLLSLLGSCSHYITK
jgi:hypothetical protein